MDLYPPLFKPAAVHATITLHHDEHGSWVVAGSIHDTASHETIAIEVSAPMNEQSARTEVRTLIDSLFRDMPMLVDSPPFP